MDAKKPLFFIAGEVINVFAFPPPGDECKAVVAPLLEKITEGLPVTFDPSNADPNVIVGVTRTSWMMIGEEVMYVCLNIVPYRPTDEYLAHCSLILKEKGFTEMESC